MFVALSGKLAVSGSFAFIYMYSAELFPTQVRNIGAGVATIGARLGGIFSPMVLLLVSIESATERVVTSTTLVLVVCG